MVENEWIELNPLRTSSKVMNDPSRLAKYRSGMGAD